MSKLRTFIRTSLIGGIVVISPIVILIFIFRWVFNAVTNVIKPITSIIMQITVESGIQKILADVTAISVIILTCFVVGIFVRTKFGTYIYRALEESILKSAPGYSLIKETITHFLSSKKTPFSKVALVKIFDEKTLATAFIMDEHIDGSYTVFVPTSPNLTSGRIYHVTSDKVYPIDVPAEDVMRSLISYGAGSSKLVEAKMKKYRGEIKEPTPPA